jgi:hypothetical protein
MVSVRKAADEFLAKKRIGEAVTVEGLERSIANDAHRQTDGRPPVEDLTDSGRQLALVDRGHDSNARISADGVGAARLVVPLVMRRDLLKVVVDGRTLAA